MTDKIVEMTAGEFRSKLQEMVRTEIVKQIMEADEVPGAETSVDPLRAKQERLLDLIRQKIGAKELVNFAKFAKTQVGEKDAEMKGLNDPAEILARLAEIFSGKVIPAGLSLNALLQQFKSWHAKGGAGIKRLGMTADAVPDRAESGEKEGGENMTADIAGGVTLEKIGAMLDPNRTFTPTAINDILKKLTAEGGKLDIMRQMIKHYLEQWAEGDQGAITNFTNAMKRAVTQAAGRYVDYIEQARNMDPEGETVTLENLHKVLDANKLRDSMGPEDMAREDILLSRLIEYANDPEAANDDEWKDVAMEMLSDDLLDAPIFAPREELNIVKSFQNLVSNILKPPPRRGRPPKAK